MTKDIKATIKQYIIKEFSIENGDEAIANDTPLMSSGILDSISTLQLVEFIEKEFNVEFQPHEVDQDNLNSLTVIENFILEKLK